MKAIGIQLANGVYVTSLATVASKKNREKAMRDLRMLAAAGNPTVVFDDSDL